MNLEPVSSQSEFLALNMVRSVDVSGLRRVMAIAAARMSQDIGRIQTARAMSGILNDLSKDQGPLSMAEVAFEVAAKYGLTVNDLISADRRRDAAWARHEAFWLARKQMTASGEHRHSFPAIGRFFGRDHTTVIHGVRAHRIRMAGGGL